MITYRCAHCKANLETDDSSALTPETCPYCKRENIAPKSKEQLKEERRKQKEAETGARAAELAKRTQMALAAQAAERARTEEAGRLLMEEAEAEKREYGAAVASAKMDPQLQKTWYCSNDGKEWGPMPESRLQTWISERRIKADDAVRPEGVNRWIRVADLPEIFVVPAEKPPEIVHQDSAAQDGPRCPKCGSPHVSANKKGMDAGNACCGALLLGPFGLLCGLSDKVVVTCLKCGHQWKVGR